MALPGLPSVTHDAMTPPALHAFACIPPLLPLSPSPSPTPPTATCPPALQALKTDPMDQKKLFSLVFKIGITHLQTLGILQGLFPSVVGYAPPPAPIPPAPPIYAPPAPHTSRHLGYLGFSPCFLVRERGKEGSGQGTG